MRPLTLFEPRMATDQCGLTLLSSKLGVTECNKRAEWVSFETSSVLARVTHRWHVLLLPIHRQIRHQTTVPRPITRFGWGIWPHWHLNAVSFRQADHVSVFVNIKWMKTKRYSIWSVLGRPRVSGRTKSEHTSHNVHLRSKGPTCSPGCAGIIGQTCFTFPS